MNFKVLILFNNKIRNKLKNTFFIGFNLEYEIYLYHKLIIADKIYNN